MNPSLKQSLIGCICLLALISGVVDAGEVADELRGVSSIQFYPKVPYAQLEITVSGGGVYWQQQYAPGESVFFSASLAGVSGLPDGVYTYQLNAAPELDMEAWEAAEGDEAAERALEQEELANTYRQFGSFEVVQGMITQREQSNDAKPSTN